MNPLGRTTFGRPGTHGCAVDECLTDLTGFPLGRRHARINSLADPVPAEAFALVTTLRAIAARVAVPLNHDLLGYPTSGTIWVGNHA